MSITTRLLYLISNLNESKRLNFQIHVWVTQSSSGNLSGMNHNDGFTKLKHPPNSFNTLKAAFPERGNAWLHWGEVRYGPFLGKRTIPLLYPPLDNSAPGGLAAITLSMWIMGRKNHKEKNSYVSSKRNITQKFKKILLSSWR